MKQISLFLLSGLVLMSFSACDMLNMPKQTHDDMSSMKDSTHKDMGDMQANMTEVKREGKMGVALQNILLDENTQYLYPVPTGIMPWAQALADTLTENEFMKLMDDWQRRINQIALTCDDIGGTKTNGVCGPANLLAESDHKKQATFWAMAAVSGLMSQANIEQAIETEYTEGGQYNEALYGVLAARQVFIQSILMDNMLMQKDVDNLGKIVQAVQYAEQLQYINDLSFTSDIDFNLTMLFNPDFQMDVKFDPSVAPTEWAKINTAFQTSLKQQYKTEMLDPKNADGQKLVDLKNEVLAHLPSTSIQKGQQK